MAIDPWIAQLQASPPAMESFHKYLNTHEADAMEMLINESSKSAEARSMIKVIRDIRAAMRNALSQPPMPTPIP